jgi:hypothetical protein
MQIPPLRLPNLDLLLPKKEESFFKKSQPEYWFGDRLLTTRGWGICIGLKKCKSLNEWLYYIDLDESTHPQPFFTKEIIQKHGCTA